MTAVFITATGTEIGKTFIARGMIAELRARGRSVEALLYSSAARRGVGQ